VEIRLNDVLKYLNIAANGEFHESSSDIMRVINSINKTL